MKASRFLVQNNIARCLQKLSLWEDADEFVMLDHRIEAKLNYRTAQPRKRNCIAITW